MLLWHDVMNSLIQKYCHLNYASRVSKLIFNWPYIMLANDISYDIWHFLFCCRKKIWEIYGNYHNKMLYNYREKMEKKESADAQKHNLDFVCIKYDFIPHPIHKTNQIYQTIKQSNFDSVFAHYLICCHIPHTHISLLIKNDAWRIGSMLDEMYNQGKPEHRKIVWYIYVVYYKIVLSKNCFQQY